MSSIIQALFFLIEIQLNMCEQKKKRQRIYDLLNAKTKPKFICLTYTKQKKNFYRKKSFLRKRRSGRSNKKREEIFSTALATAKKDPITLIRKHANELKVHKKTVITTIKQDLSPDNNPLDYAIWGLLENNTNATSHSNIGSLNTAIEEEWNKMSEEFILKAY